MSLSTFTQHKKEWETTKRWKELADKYGLLNDNPRCVEESYQENIRAAMLDPRTAVMEELKPELEDMIKKANNTSTFMQTSDKELQKKFWKRQLSGTFFKGNPPPCPLLTALNQQRYEVELCYVRHCAKTIENWIEWHKDSLEKLPTMLTGNHTSNCVHNAHIQVVKQLQSFESFTEEIEATDPLKEKLKDEKTKRPWLSTDGMESYMLNEDCTDTMVI